MPYCKCGVEIPPCRVEFLQKNNLPLTCINHSTTQKVGGYMSTDGKTDRTLIIGDMQTIENLYKLSARAGVGVSKGVKMNQSFDSKLYK